MFQLGQNSRELVVVQSENHKGLLFRSAALSREEAAVSLLAASRFLADRAGFGMTKGGVVLHQFQHEPKVGYGSESNEARVKKRPVIWGMLRVDRSETRTHSAQPPC
jgi:hypothetical protein